MRRLILLAALVSAGRLPVFAAGPSVGPGEPEILLPKVILEIEDLSVEKLDATLPPEEELLPPRREIPLPAEGEIPVGEASLPMPGVGSETPAAAAPSPISAEAVLGAGMQASILGSLSLKTQGEDPRLSFSFSHESLDGFFANPPHPAGSGFSKRNDDLTGELSTHLGPVQADARGSFSEEETGLQSQRPAYITGLSRTADGFADFTFSPLEWLSLKGTLQGGILSATLTGADPRPADEYRISPVLAATAHFESVRLGLSTEYSYRWAEIQHVPLPDVHRARVGLSLGWDLPASLLLEGSAAFFWSTEARSLLPFPFELAFSGTPVDYLTFRLGFGYRVRPYDLKDLLEQSPLLLPAPVADDRGWFGEARVQIAPVRSLSVSAALSFMASEAMPDALAVNGALTQDPVTGLFLPQHIPANRLSSDVSLRWNAVPGLTLVAGWKHEFRDFLFLDSPSFLPVDDITFEGIGIAPDGSFGGNLSAALRTGTAPTLQLPDVTLGGFLRVSEGVRLQLDIEDLLQPAQGARYGLYPYIEPGFRVTGKVRMSF